jgi:MFS family permease
MSSTPAAPAAPVSNPWLIALSVMLATFMEVLDTSIASVALPYIAGTVSATNDEATWVLTSYLVANAVILPASAWFSQRFGRKRFLITCIVIFTVSSFAWRRRVTAALAGHSAGELSAPSAGASNGLVWAGRGRGSGAGTNRGRLADGDL